MPAVVEHRLGQPLIRVILNEVIQKAQYRVGRQSRASGKLAFKSPNQRGGVHHRFDFALFVWQKEGRQESDFGARQTQFAIPVADQQFIADVSKAHVGEHLAGIGRAGHALHLQWFR